MPLNSPTPDRAAGGLYVVATPIGHLEDITLRAIRILQQVDLIAAEDTRHTRRLLAAHHIQNQLISYHEHNERQRTTELVDRLVSGTAIALVSDAGTPTVSDPGYRLVEAAAARGIPIIPIPGLPTDSFTFVGFPLRKKAKRLQQLQQLAAVAQTLIFYQSPRRVLTFLAEVKEAFGDRPAVLARELTKLHEEFLRGSLTRIIEQLKQRAEIKGECTLLVGGAQAVEPAGQDLDTAIADALAQSDRSLSELAKDLARRLGVPRKEIYDKALALKAGRKC
jgi:16S rRNA (cytidine1402-2'-O)-methyltransferase